MIPASLAMKQIAETEHGVPLPSQPSGSEHLVGCGCTDLIVLQESSFQKLAAVCFFLAKRKDTIAPVRRSQVLNKPLRRMAAVQRDPDGVRSAEGTCSVWP